MTTTTPDNLWSPDGGDAYALTTDLAAMQDTVQEAFNESVHSRNQQFYDPAASRTSITGMKRGDTFQESDGSHKLWLFDGLNWVDISRGVYLLSNAAGTRVRVGMATSGTATSTQTGIGATDVEINNTSVTITLTESTDIVFEGEVTTYSGSTSDVIALNLRDNTTSLLESASPANSSPVAAATSMRQYIAGQVTLAAGTHRLNLAIRRIAGSGSVTAGCTPVSPFTLRVDRLI